MLSPSNVRDGVGFPPLAHGLAEIIRRLASPSHDPDGRCERVELVVQNPPQLRDFGDVVSDLHQIAVGTGHAAIAATHVHNSLPQNLR